MQLKVVKDKSFKEKVHYRVIHGKFPYKTYLEIKGNCKFGRYIAIVSNVEIKDISEIAIKLPENLNTNNIDRGPDIVKKDFLHYKVKEVDIFTVGDTPLAVFKPLMKKE